MLKQGVWLVLAMTAFPLVALADPSTECSIGRDSQVEISSCVSKAEAEVEATIGIFLGFAMKSAGELDRITGREVALPALNDSQAKWSSYRDSHCEFVGTTFGGGSGTGIAITSCRIELGRARADELMKYSR